MRLYFRESRVTFRASPPHMLEDNPILSRITARFHLIVATIVSLIVAAIFGASAGEGDFLAIYVTLFGAFLVTIMLQLGPRYWLILPFSFVTQLPTIPIQDRLLELPEIVSVVCGAFFLVRYALKQQKFTFFRKEHTAVQLYAAWALFIFINNPVGLSEMGASLGGLRFYAKIGLALVAFVVMANQEIGEKECKWVIILILFGSFVSEAQDILFFFFPFHADPNQKLDPDSYYSWHQALATVPMVVIAILFSHYRSSQIFSVRRVWALGLFLASVGMIVASGKRSAVAAIPFYAVAAAIVRKEFGFVVLWAMGAVLAATLVVVGHGDLFHLPLTAQRALSILPARWDPEIASMEGGRDEFRDMLRLLAKEKIQRDPWIGGGYKVDLQLLQRMATRGANGMEEQVTPCALSSAWHNTWLGYAADFGIPASILVGIIYLTVLHRSWRTFRESPPNSLAQTLSMYILLFTLRDLALSHAGGHSATDAFTRWWMYGLLVALTLSNRQRLAGQATAGVLTGGRTMLQPGFADRPARQLAGVRRPSAF